MKENRREAVTDDGFLQAWRKYIGRNSDQHILCDAMTKARPERAAEFEYRVLVQHPAQLQAFELAMPKLMEFLRDELNNDFLTVRAEIDTSVSDAPVQLPPAEFLKKIVETNPIMGKFLKDIQGEIV